MTGHMKEKRVPSASLSGCGSFALLCLVAMSLYSTFWLGTINPYSVRARFDVWQTRWDVTQEKLFFARSSEQRFYTLERDGSITCEFQTQRAQQPVQSLTSAQHTMFENRYGTIENYDVVAKDVVVLIILKPTQFIGLPFSVYNSELILVRNINNGDAIAIDARMLHKVDQKCYESQSILLPGLMFIVGTGYSLMFIRILRHRIRWLCLILICLTGSYVVGYILSFFRGAGSDF